MKFLRRNLFSYLMFTNQYGSKSNLQAPLASLNRAIEIDDHTIDKTLSNKSHKNCDKLILPGSALTSTHNSV